MNTSKMVDIAEICSSVAIVITLIVLIIEVRGNTEAIQIQTINTQLDKENESRAWLFLNEGGIGDLVFKSRSEEPLTDSENWRLDRYYAAKFDTYEWEYGEVEAGRLPEILLDVENRRAMVLAQPKMRESFERSKARRNPAFVSYWEENIISEQ